MSGVFAKDDEFSKKYRWFYGILYKAICYEGRYVFAEESHFSMLVQRSLKTDVIWQITQDTSVGVEEKVVRWPGYIYERFFLETESCTNPKTQSDGWMKNGEADYLFYVFERLDIQALHAYIIDFQLLKPWFKEHCENYEESTMREGNKTRGRKVDIKDVEQAVPCINWCIGLDEIKDIQSAEVVEWWKGMERQQQEFVEREAMREAMENPDLSWSEPQEEEVILPSGLTSSPAYQGLIKVLERAGKHEEVVKWQKNLARSIAAFRKKRT